jgi:CheY-like chemotaxis protein
MMSAATILLVEDNDDDVALIRRAFKQCKIVNPLQVASDGDSAVAYLAGQAGYQDRTAYPMPLLVLLDLKLPRRSGLEVLNWMKRNPVLKHIPVVVLTSSRENLDVRRAYDAGANSYLVKPVEFADLRAMMDTIHVYWVMTNVTPVTSE